MSLINPDKAILSPRLSQPFTITRSVGQFNKGGWSEGTPISISARGVITVSSAKELVQIPEADRVQGAMTFFSKTEMHATRNAQSPEISGTSDKITWRGDQYRIIQILPYMDYGYCKAIGVRIRGD